MDQRMLGEVDTEPGNSDKVADIASARRKREEREPAASDAELREYREMLPKLRQMLREWEQLKGANGCPVMQGILGIVE